MLITLVEQHFNRLPPTVVTQAINWWETVLALAKLQEIGLGVHLPVEVCYYTLCTCVPFVSVHELMALIGSHVNWEQKLISILQLIMAYGSMPYVGMTPNKNGSHIKGAQMIRSKCLC